MKKIYSLLLLLTVFFGFGGIKGYGQQTLDSRDPYKVKIGDKYLSLAQKKATLVDSKDDATTVKVDPDVSNTNIEFQFGDSGHSFCYNTNRGKFLFYNGGPYANKFLWTPYGGKHYLKTTGNGVSGPTPKKAQLENKYIGISGGALTLVDNISDAAPVEFLNNNANSMAEAKPAAWKFAMFQKRYIGGTYQESLLMGTKLGQYEKHLPSGSKVGTHTTWDFVTAEIYKPLNQSQYGTQDAASTVKEQVEMVLTKLTINKPSNGMYVRISNKSQYEHDMRETTKDRLFPLNGGNAFSTEGQPGPEVAAKYLKETAAGFTTTTNANEAAVFFYDGEHLTSVSNGLGLTGAAYATTGAAQKVTVGQGKIEKTFDAGSYSLKTAGGQFVKLDESGVSLSANESDSHLFLEEVEKFNLSTLAQGYVSFYAPTAVEFPEGTEVYVGKLNGANSAVNFTKLNTRQVPANTAVVLRKGTAAGTALEVKKLATASAVSNNALKGYTVSSTDHKAGAYALSTEGGQLVFKKVGDAVRGFKAVIYKNGGAGAPAYLPVDILPTGIDAVNADNTEEEVFDLTGRRVESPVKGKVYVKNGKKFVQQ